MTSWNCAISNYYCNRL